MTLADLIINAGPFATDGHIPGRLRDLNPADLDELRDELIAGRKACDELNGLLHDQRADGQPPTRRRAGLA